MENLVDGSSCSGSTDVVSFKPDGSVVNARALQQHLRRDSKLLAQLFKIPELAKIVLEDDLDKLQELLRKLHCYCGHCTTAFGLHKFTELKGFDENRAAVLLRNPLTFDATARPYVEMKINGVPIKALVDSGAQSTIISRSLALQIGLWCKIDRCYEGTPHGVGQSKILGLVFYLLAKIGARFYRCPALIMDSPTMGFVLGLDMLIEHKFMIDSKKKVLIVGHEEPPVPFLPEKDIWKEEARAKRAKLGPAEPAAKDVLEAKYHQKLLFAYPKEDAEREYAEALAKLNVL